MHELWNWRAVQPRFGCGIHFVCPYTMALSPGGEHINNAKKRKNSLRRRKKLFLLSPLQIHQVGKVTGDKSCSDERFWCMEIQAVCSSVRQAVTVLAGAAHLALLTHAMHEYCLARAPRLKDCADPGAERGKQAARKCEERCVEVQSLSLSYDPKVPPPLLARKLVAFDAMLLWANGA